MFLVLFGLPGVGKSFIGKMLENEFGFHHYEADDDLTQPIKEAIQKNLPITQPMRESYFEEVCKRIAALKTIHPNLVITQTFIKEKDRKQIIERFPEAKLIWVHADFPIIYARLAKRDHLVRGSYAAFAIAQFEPPAISHQVLMNNGGIEEIRPQLIRILDLQDRSLFELQTAINNALP